MSASRIVWSIVGLLSLSTATSAVEKVAKLNEFGSSVDVSGDYIVMGAPGDQSLQQGNPHGAAYVFKRDGGVNWVQHAKIYPSVLRFHAQFGYSVAIDGDWLVAGSPKLDPAGTHYGSAYVFRRDPGGWIEEVRLALPGPPGPGNAFGHSVAIEGDVLVVGAYELNRAYVYRRNGTTWVEDTVLTGSDSISGDRFGWAVSISSGRIAVGAFYGDSATQDSGAAYVFAWTGTNWAEEAKLTASDGAAGDLFGSAISLAGDEVIIGAYGADDGGSTSGVAYVFSRDDSGWSQQAKLKAPNPAAQEAFGGSVALHGLLAMVGSPGDSEAGFRVGAVYVFQCTGGHWAQRQKLLPAPGGGGLGASLGTDGTHAVSNSYVYFTPPLPPCVPALSRWGVVVMILGIAVVAAVRFRRRSPVIVRC